MKHKTRDEVIKSLSDHEFIAENRTCPECGGIIVSNCGPGVEVDFCVDCDYDDYDYSDIDI